MFDVILVSLFVAGAVIYLGFRLRKKIRALRDPKASAGCSCGCDCAKKNIAKKK